MGLFGNTTDASIQEEVEKATSSTLLDDDWSVIISICDKAGKSSEDAKAWLRAIVRRLYNPDPHVGLRAVTLLDACVKNSGKTFHIEVASREFENDFTKLMSKGHVHVSKRLREVLKRWSENEFKSDGKLNLIPSLYNKLKLSYDFSSSEAPSKKLIPTTTDPNVVESQEEEEQILKAIELSLKETTLSSGASKTTSTAPLYPSVNNLSNVPSSSSSSNSPNIVTGPAKELRKVRALYDFVAVEDNELTFNSGEIIVVLDDTDANWWKGSNQRGEGLFPANFVTDDLSVEPEQFLYEKTKKNVHFKEERPLEKEPQEIEINEEKIDRLLHLLHEADPTNFETDTDELLNLEREVNAMGPLIDSELERVDRRHAQLTQLSASLVEALQLYHVLMREPQVPAAINKSALEPASYGYPPHSREAVYAGQPPPPQQLPPQSIGYPPNFPRGIPERVAYGPPHMNPYAMSGMSQPHGPASMPPPQSSGGGMPHQNYPQQIVDGRRMEGGMLPSQFPSPGMLPNFRMMSMPQAAYTGPTLPNNPGQQLPPPQPQQQQQQQPHYVSSSTHMIN